MNDMKSDLKKLLVLTIILTVIGLTAPVNAESKVPAQQNNVNCGISQAGF